MRSEAEFGRHDMDGFGQRASMKGMGFTSDAFRHRPVVGICNTWSDLVHCNRHFRELAEHVKRGIMQAGGMAVEFNVLSLGEPFMKPTTMMFRNLMAMDVEEAIRANPMDAVVLLGGCDKTIPALLMGAISADVPAVVLPGGPQLNSRWRGRDVGACTDCWRTDEMIRSGGGRESDLGELEDVLVRSAGHCAPMGTASTMACLAEALGMTLPGAAAIPAADSRRAQIAEQTGRLAVNMAKVGPRPAQIITAQSLQNARTVLQAIGGSTNGIIHLAAIAGRLGISVSDDDMNEAGARTPWLVNLKPSGEYLMEDFYFAGGMPALLYEIRDLIATDELTVTGGAIGDQIPSEGTLDVRVIRPRAEGVLGRGSTVVLSGSLCPGGAVLKVAAASPELRSHEGPAIVFDGLDDLNRRIDDPDLPVDQNSVFVLRGMGPVGAPGMPECGHLPIPRKLLSAGVTDVVRISDARMSGTAYGTCVLHVAPESAVGGPLSLVRDGDPIRLDVDSYRLELLVSPEELERRRATWRAPNHSATRGYARLYVEHVQQADKGCDFDFLVADPGRDT